ncbi:MAG: GNAT family N-acetyltransferase [Parvularculaceae bacterium]|nr:GNAT family N-acetyltransferase [Parvularculaceae bacterium]
MASKITCRAAGPRDLKTIVALCDALNAHLNMPTGRLEEKKFRASMFGKNAFVFCDLAEAVEDGEARPEIVGYALSHDCFTTDFGERGVYLIDVYVEPAWRRSGAGLALVRTVARRAKKRGATHVWWGSAPSNAPARRFYAALGASDERFHVHTLSGRAFDKLAGR